MRIAFFGSSLVSCYWNGAATYYRGIVRALHGRGHGITFYEPDIYERQAHRDIQDPSWARVVVYPADQWERTVERARGVDVVVKATGVGANDCELEAAVVELGAPVTVFWDVDAPATLARLDADREDPLLELLPRYDLVLTYGGGDPVVDHYRALGARDCVPVYNALDPTTHRPAAADARFEADLAFLGNRLPDREERVEAFFLRAAELAPRRSFLLGGAGWGDVALRANVVWIDHVPTRDHNALNCSARAVLNVNRDSMARFGFSPPTRVFEAAGAGACLITDAWEGVELFLEPDEEVLVARDGTEVAELVEGLDAKRARAIGKRARRRVLAEHTYDRRAELVERVLSGVAV